MIRPLIARLTGAAALALMTGCVQEQEPVDVTRTERFEERGLSFSYPASWQLSREDAGEDLLWLYIEDEGSAITAVLLLPMPDDAPLDLTAFAADWSSETVLAVEDMPLGFVSDSAFDEVSFIPDRPMWERLEERFAITLLGETVPHTRTFVCTGPCQGRVAVLVHQVASEDAALVQDGFDLITSSLALER